MKRLIILIFILSNLMLTGCSNKKHRIRNQVQEVQVPLLYCPAPPQLSQPALPIHIMTSQQKSSSGELVKHYKATIQSLFGYIDELEQALESYNNANKSYDDLRKELENIVAPQ